jgi:hypothetical protein
MKKLITLSIILLTCLSAKASIYRVNNNPGTAAQYTVAQTAHDACNPGDTLYIEGTTISYGTLNISKKINIIGPGYFLAQNPNTQVNPTSALFTLINCNAGSAGTYLTGLDINDLMLATGVNNIVIKRNHIGCPTCYNSVSSSGVLYLQGSNANILIIQNYVSCSQNYGSGKGSPIALMAGCSNITIGNNYCEGTGSGYDVIYVDVAASAVITNNIFKGTTNAPVTINNSTFNNNFILTPGSPSFNGSSNSQNNNFSIYSQLDTTGGNVHNNHINIPMATLVVGTGSSDGQWKLKAGSPAIGAGYGGGDCGIFGGSDPYVLSGLPTVPAIYFFSAPSSGSGTLPVQVKIMSHK